jgi:hypothetical protein
MVLAVAAAGGAGLAEIFLRRWKCARKSNGPAKTGEFGPPDYKASTLLSCAGRPIERGRHEPKHRLLDQRRVTGRPGGPRDYVS